jgi:hypothetical protein
MQSGSLVHKAMLIWTATQCLEDSWHLSRVQFSEIWSDFNKLVPITPILSYQIETAIQLQLLEPVRIDALSNLQSIIFNRGREDWMPTFLTMFILLHTYDLLLEHYRHWRPAGNKQVYISMPSEPELTLPTHRFANTSIWLISVILRIVLIFYWHIFT